MFGYHVMKMLFKENNCRFCKKVFCCVSCRKKHESVAHHVNSDCDLCIYGETVLRNLKEELLKHINSHHLPVHCKFCKRVFISIDEVMVNNLCAMNKKPSVEGSSKTPVRTNLDKLENKTELNFDSPPVMYPFGENNINANIIISVTNNIVALTTSTPMQGGDENKFLDNISQSITPVEPPKRDVDKGSQVEVECIGRRVTFNETQLTETFDESSSKKVQEHLKGVLKKRVIKRTKNKDMVVVDETCDNWETAISESSPPVKRNEINILSDITNVLNDTNLKKNDPEIAEINCTASKEDINKKQESTSIWGSVSNIVRSVFSGLSSLSSHNKEIVEEITHKRVTKRLSIKRLRSDSDISEGLVCLKRMKFTDIKCRKPINSTAPYKFFLEEKIIRVSHKSTQTD